MEIGVTFFIVAILVVAIWVVIELKRARHKIFAVFLIALILFTYISFTMVIKEQNLDLKSISGLTKAGKLYFLWIGHAFGNMKSITSNVIKMDWKGNTTSTKTVTK